MSETKRFTLRMDNDLFNVIKKSAEKNRRSIAKEIEFILFQECKRQGTYIPKQDGNQDNPEE